MTVAKVWDGTTWVPVVGATGPVGPAGPTGPAGPPTLEVWIAANAPAPRGDYTVWVDTDETPAVWPPPVVTVLPSPATDGQEVYFRLGTSPAPKWHLRYSAAYDALDGYGWECLGGADVLDEQTGVISVTSSTAVSSGGPTVTPSLPGIYDVKLGAMMRNNTQNSFTIMEPWYGGATLGWHAEVATPAAGGALNEYIAVSMERRWTFTVVSAVECRYRTAQTGTYYNRFLRLRPVRVKAA